MKQKRKAKVVATENAKRKTALPRAACGSESEALPNLPTENVAQFIGRMNRDFDLTKI